MEEKFDYMSLIDNLHWKDQVDPEIDEVPKGEFGDFRVTTEGPIICYSDKWYVCLITDRDIEESYRNYPYETKTSMNIYIKIVRDAEKIVQEWLDKG